MQKKTMKVSTKSKLDEFKRAAKKMKTTMDNTVLKKGTLHCPKDKTTLHFENVHGMRVVKNGVLSAYCPKCEAYFDVTPDGN